MRASFIALTLLLLAGPLLASSRPPAFSTIHYHDDTGYSRTFASSDTYYRSEPTTEVSTTSMQSDRCTGQTTATIIVGPHGAGHYWAAFAISFGGVAANTYEFELFLDETGQDELDQRRTIGTGADTGSAGVASVIYIPANTEISLRVQNIGSTGAATIYRQTIALVRLGP